MKQFDRFKDNLKYENEFVYSYNTKVAHIFSDHLLVLGYWSFTTSKHINYAARELGLPVRDK